MSHCFLCLRRMAGPQWGVQYLPDIPTNPNVRTMGSTQTGGAPARQTSPGNRTPLPTNTVQDKHERHKDRTKEQVKKRGRHQT